MRVYFDFISPYAYLAWKALPAIADNHGVAPLPVPTLFAGLLNHWGQKGPAEIAPKRIYTFKNVSRIAHSLGVPMAPPPAHPFNPLLALRVASLAPGTEQQVAAIDALYDATWGGGPGVDKPEKVARLLQKRGLDGAALVDAASRDETKARLRQQTNEAIDAGVFGVPSIVVEGELFWGYDSLPHLDAFLAGDDPLEPDLMAQWAHVRPSATR